MHHTVTEKADTYSLGSLLYFLLTGEKPYRLEPAGTLDHTSATQNYKLLNQTEVEDHILQGKLPHLPKHMYSDQLYNVPENDNRLKRKQNQVRRRKDDQVVLEKVGAAAIDAIVYAMRRAFTYHAQERPSARWIANYLDSEWRRCHNANGKGK